MGSLVRYAPHGGIASWQLRGAALQYAVAGWPVVPCHWTAGGRCVCGNPECQGKRPWLKGWQHKATTDPATIRGWWDQWPYANVGIATGSPGPDVLDIDTKGGRPGAASLAGLRRAGLLRGVQATVTTPSGGLHLYFAGTGQGNGTHARSGVDFRGAGGYVLAPPSQVDGRLYELVGSRGPTGAVCDWAAVRRLLDPPRAASPSRSSGEPGDCAQLVAWVAEQGEGNRNAGLHWAACRAREAGAGRSVYLALADAAESTGLPWREAVATVRSATGGEVVL